MVTSRYVPLNPHTIMFQRYKFKHVESLSFVGYDGNENFTVSEFSI